MINCYATGHEISNIIMAAFAEGFEGNLVPPNNLLPGSAAMYGILRGTGELIHQCKWVQRDFYYVDHGYFRRGHFEGFYRVTKNRLQNNTPGIVCDDRWRALGIDYRPWRRDGGHVLVIPITDAVGSFLGIVPDTWLKSVINEARLHTDREIRVKPKGEGDLKEDLKDCWCVIVHSSNVAMNALANGIPVITLGESAAAPLSWDFSNIEHPEWPDREPLFHWLAYNQFTLSELKDGTARRILDDCGRME